MSDIKAARELATRALVDLEALRELVENPRVADEIFGFLAQQAVEKSLKAWLAYLGKQYPVTHNLGQLLKKLQDTGVKEPLYGDLNALSPFAVQFRYETMDSTEPGLDRQDILRMVGALVVRVNALINNAPESGPTAREPHAVYGTAPPRGSKSHKPRKKTRKKK